MKQRKTILVISTCGFYGGGEKAILDIVNRMKEDFRIVFMTEKNAEVESAVEKIGVEMVRARFRYGLYFPDMIRILRKIAAIDPDTILINGRKGKLFCFGAALLGQNARMIEWVHLPYFSDETSLLRSVLVVMMHYVPSKVMDHIMCISTEIHKEMNMFGMSARSSVVHPPIDLKGGTGYKRRANRARLRKQLKIKSGDTAVLYMSRIEDVKGQMRVLEYLESKGVFRRNGTVKMVFYGDGSGRDELRKWTERYPHCIHYGGFRKDVSELLPLADVYLLYSKNEGLPISMLECMAIGVPPVVTPVGEIPYFIKDGRDGILVETLEDVHRAIVEKKYERLKKADVIKKAGACDARTIYGKIRGLI